MSFMIFQNEKTPLWDIKTRSSKSRRIDIFPRGLTHGFGPRTTTFSTFFFQAIQARKNVFYDILGHKKRLSRLQKQEVQKVEKLTFFPKGLTHSFGPKMAIFSIFFFGNKGQENVIYDTLERKKKPVQAIKTRSSKSGKINIFLKGLTQGFGPKMALFPTFFFRQNRPGKSFL